MSEARDFAAADRLAAENFATAARAAGVRRIIYLGGLGGDDANSSRHLRSRHEVGEILRRLGPQVIEFRASIILGSGSLSFEMIRSLVECLPAMVTPRWVSTPCQPIVIADVLPYLVGALELPGQESVTFEIGGADRMSYGELMKEYARRRGLKRLMIPVPVLTPWLSGLWLVLVTPAHYRIGRRLIGGLSTPTLADDAAARAIFGVTPTGVPEAIATILSAENRRLEGTLWSRELGNLPAHQRLVETQRMGCYVAACRRTVSEPPQVIFGRIEAGGGDNGWYCGSTIWQIRGCLDRLIGGPGLGCTGDTGDLKAGDRLGSWRVVLREPSRRLRLRSEMRLPGRAWLDFEVNGDGERSTVQLTAVFDPRGLTGLLYWQILRPVHRWLFRRLVHQVAP
ncbi:MAG: DUF2867 domain-containing protein [Armatimonadota bacterium]